MCGIAGIIISDSGSTLDSADLKRLAAALAHRGPDGEGIWVSPDGSAGFVHRRLAIIDTSESGHQPMHTPDGEYTIVFNGEIYNFIELRKQLRDLGHSFRTDSDTEVILHAWRQWREGMLHRFNGMWALAIRDNRSGEVFLARDRFGIKPLFYSTGGGRVAFASELRALKSLPWLDRQIDVAVARRVVFDAFSIEAGDRSLLKAVSRLPAGHMATIRPGGIDVSRWWHTCRHLVSVPEGIEAQADRFREVFHDAVQLRMRSDVSLGTCLSGGFDSSAITCAMAALAADTRPHVREARDWRHAFIASFPGMGNDETPQALEAAAYARVNPHVLTLNDNDAMSQIDTVLEDLDDIYISLPTAPWLIYRELRRAHTVVSLDGHGADELMGAYRQDGRSLNFHLRNFVAWSVSHFSAAAMVADAAKALMLTAKHNNHLRGYAANGPADLGTPFDRDELPAHWGALNRRLYRMFHATVLPTILRNFDRLSMAHGIEVRMPFMDWRLVTYVMSLPDSAKSSDGLTKFVARKAMAGRMPDGIRTARRKVGFNSPMPEWLNGPLHAWCMDLLGRDNPAYAEIVDLPGLRKQIAHLHKRSAWDWNSVGALWPYIHLKWLLDRQAIAQ